ncbi:hypothetical protein BABINDRAFT_162623 [Babjeviella inositovora NRRL Y-12698]|uniref:Uncharacterized protein n=1 Tax=Babjeviella inositovora NRRL Y-12698 TaxID=984486 RepID=A0A1E3QL15_9ASCO|nr:uncharacterized protein BABINDRAFT_162623 [Babjeviella inositovora NRRL Y-12698]ODQ78386.1 hypothetical protein BABINDRAFT_162623 [Babjeviella inositovora NRRL Y-12698]
MEAKILMTDRERKIRGTMRFTTPSLQFRVLIVPSLLFLLLSSAKESAFTSKAHAATRSPCEISQSLSLRSRLEVAPNTRTHQSWYGETCRVAQRRAL